MMNFLESVEWERRAMAARLLFNGRIAACSPLVGYQAAPVMRT
jgi:hypothetical protein